MSDERCNVFFVASNVLRVILKCPLMFSTNDVLIGKLAKGNRLQLFLLELKCLLGSFCFAIVQRIHALLQQRLKSVGFCTSFLE